MGRKKGKREKRCANASCGKTFVGITPKVVKKRMYCSNDCFGQAVAKLRLTHEDVVRRAEEVRQETLAKRQRMRGYNGKFFDRKKHEPEE